MPINPGLLRTKVKFKKIVQTKDASGGAVRSYGEIFVRMCRATIKTASESQGEYQQMNVVSWELQLRWDSKIDSVRAEEYDIFIGDRLLDNVSIINSGMRNRDIIIYCTEKQ